MTARVTDTTGSMGGGWAAPGVSYAAGQVVDGHIICGAKKKNLDPCGMAPLKGATRCGNHGGKAPQVQAKARERIIEENARGILGRISPDANKTHPVEMLVNLIHAKGAEVSWLRGKVQDLDEGELTWGRVQHDVGVGPEGPIDKETFKAEQSVWWRLLREAENQLANWITMALKAGVEERRVRVAEDQGQMVAGVIQTILTGLDLTPAQQAQVPLIVPKALRALAE